MSDEILENFGTYRIGQIQDLIGFPWSITGSGNGCTISTSRTRNSPSSLRFATNRTIERGYNGVAGWNYVGCAILVEFTGSQTTAGFGFQGATSSIRIGVDDQQRLEIRRGTTLLAETPVAQIALDTWYYVELLYRNDTGEYKVYINGGLELAGSMTAIGIPNSIRIGPVSSTTINSAIFFTDLFGVPARSSIYGDVAIINVTPDTDEMPQDWTAVPGPDAFADINSIPYNDATYIEAASVGDESRFGVTFSQTTFQVHAIALQWRAQKTTASTVEVVGRIYAGAIPNSGPPRSLSQTNADTYYEAFNTNPNTGMEFNEVELAAAEIEFERVT